MDQTTYESRYKKFAESLIQIKRKCICCSILMHVLEGVGTGLCGWCKIDTWLTICACNGGKPRTLKPYDQLEDEQKRQAQLEAFREEAAEAVPGSVGRTV